MKAISLLLYFAVLLMPVAVFANPLIALSGSPPSVGGHTYIINEDFEGTGAPSGWYNGATPDWDNTSSPLAGAQHLRITNDGQLTITPSLGAGRSEVWVKFRFRVSALPATTLRFLSCIDVGFDNEAVLELDTDGGLISGTYTASTLETVDKIVANTSYDMELHYIKVGIGATTVSVGFVAAGGSIPSSGNKFISATDGVGNADIDAVIFYDLNPSNIDIDNVQISTTQNP
jgi:hypothetical protein